MTNDSARERFMQAATDLLLEGTPAERETAASVLGGLGNEDVIPALLHALREDENRRVQHKVSQAISRIGGQEAVEGLQDIMGEANRYTRFLAAEALADIVSSGRSHN